MKRVLNVLLAIVGIIVLVSLIYIFIIKSTESDSALNQGSATSTNSAAAINSIDKNPLLTASQEKTLENFGINPEDLPKSITPELKTCAEEKLGPTRIEEIRNGSVPNISDFLAVRSCL